MQGFINLKDSRKAALAFAGIIVTIVLLVTGQIDGNTATTSISSMIMTLMVSIAWEDVNKNNSEEK